MPIGLALGCAPRTEVTPDIPISPGWAARIAVMDRFRLHDEERKHMMKRPRVWVEEVPDDAWPDDGADDAGATVDEAPADAPQP